jgi:hypothetical protein
VADVAAVAGSGVVTADCSAGAGNAALVPVSPDSGVAAVSVVDGVDVVVAGWSNGGKSPIDFSMSRCTSAIGSKWV